MTETTDPRQAFPPWATSQQDRAMFYVLTARKLGLPEDFDTMPDDVRDFLFPVNRG